MKKTNSCSYSCYLFREPSFLEGFSRIINFSGKVGTYNFSHSARSADCRALSADWYAIGSDMEDAIYTFGSDNGLIRRGKGRTSERESQRNRAK